MREVNRSKLVLALLAASAIACGSGAGEGTNPGPPDDVTGGNPIAGAGGAGTAGSATGGSAGGAGAQSSTTSGGPALDGGNHGGAGGGGAGGASQPVYQPGGPGCGFEHAAFCDTFDTPAGGALNRAGELNPASWSGAHMCEIGGPSTDDHAVAVSSARLPSCRAGLPAKVTPDQDGVICDPSPTIKSNHLLVVAAAQNYGQNSYRVRQQFDFANRTGAIAFDAEGYNIGNHGWVSVEITQDPTPAPSFTIVQNFENGAVPQNGVEIQLALNCGGPCVGILNLLEYDNYAQRVVFDGLKQNLSVPAAQGKLNHFEVQLSTNHVAVYATPASDDGVKFGQRVLIGSADLTLGFSRGYVHFTTHNHATLKYSNGAIDAWVARWDNVGFDGPAIVGAFREYSVPDSLKATSSGMINTAFRLTDANSGTPQTLTIDGVDLKNATGARLAIENWSYHTPQSPGPADFALNYRFNDRAWHARKLNADELRMMSTIDNAGTRSIMVDVDPSELMTGKNTLELTTSNAAPQATPVALNIDLIVKTN